MTRNTRITLLAKHRGDLAPLSISSLKDEFARQVRQEGGRRRFRGDKLFLNFAFLFGVLLLLFGCSFHSNQLEMVQTLFSKKNELLEPEWRVELSTGERFMAFPLSQEDRIIFTDGRRWTVTFDGWHITEFRDRDTGTEWRLSFIGAGVALEKCPSNLACTLEYTVLKARGAPAVSTQNCESWRVLVEQGGFFKRCDNGVDLTLQYQIDVSEGGVINRIMWSFEGQSGVLSHLSEKP